MPSGRTLQHRNKLGGNGNNARHSKNTTMRKGHGLLALYGLMAAGAFAFDHNLHADAMKAGIRYNSISGKMEANGSPIYSPTKSQKIKAKRRAAQKKR